MYEMNELEGIRKRSRDIKVHRDWFGQFKGMNLD
jgi:hypothetical protein